MLRQRQDRRQLLTELVRAGHELATSALNVAEVHAGMRPDEESQTEALLDTFECFSISLTTGRLAGRFKRQWAQKGKTLSLPDTLVAAAAVENGCVLITDNIRDFPMP